MTVMKPTHRTALLLLVLLTAAGCGVPPKKMRFNNQMARTNHELATNGKSFYKAIQPIGTGQAVPASQARSALSACETTVRNAQSTYAGMLPPNNSSNGSDLLAKYRTFLNTQDSIVDSCLKPIVRIIEDDQRYPTPNEKWSEIAPLLRKADELEAKAFRDLTAAQQAYAKEHNFRLTR
jgi:hypothetical protein